MAFITDTSVKIEQISDEEKEDSIECKPLSSLKSEVIYAEISTGGDCSEDLMGKTHGSESNYIAQLHGEAKQELGKECHSSVKKENLDSSNQDVHVKKEDLTEGKAAEGRIKIINDSSGTKVEIETIHKPRIFLEDSTYLREGKFEKFLCSKCEFESTVKKSVRNHYKNRHMKRNIYACDRCDYKTNQRNVLKGHIEQTHLKIYAFKCDFCEKSYLNRNILFKHQKRVHIKAQNFKCSQCSYTTLAKSYLKSHIDAVHLGVRPFVCSHCDYRASRKQHLTTHINAIHLKIKTLHCNECSYKTADTSAMNTHYKSYHLGLKRFVCDVCSYRAYQRHIIVNHRKTVHRDLNLPPMP